MITIFGAPRTKKNSSRVLKFGKFNKVVPSEAYLTWRDSAVPQMRIAWAGRAIIADPVNVRATVYRDADRGDLIGYLQGIADALEEAGVVTDDMWIRGWDGSRLDKDAKNPRVVIEIEALT